MSNLGENIRKEREKRDFSQEFLAAELNINQSTYCKLEQDASNLTVERLYKIADVLGVDVSNLLDIDAKNIFNNNGNGNGYGNVERLNTDNKVFIEEIRLAYEKMLEIKDEQIAFLKDMVGK
jgi:transcriptional regulator with XRE-family HTH domain